MSCRRCGPASAVAARSSPRPPLRPRSSSPRRPSASSPTAARRDSSSPASRSAKPSASATVRSNVGFVEVTGKPAVVEVIAFEPDTKSSVVTQIPLKANEYVQYARFLSSMGLGTVYNGRVSVKVISGDGRVYAYGSTVDNGTE